MKTLLPFNLCLLFFSLQSLAIPSLTNRCGEKGVDIIPPDGVSIIAFNEACDTAYVGPPAAGSVTIDEVMGSTNLLFCNSVKLLPSIIEAATEGMHYWAKRITELSRDYDSVAFDLEGFGQKLAESESKLKFLNDSIELQSRVLVEKRTEAFKAKEAWNDCALNAKSDVSCQEEHRKFQALLGTVESLKSKMAMTEEEAIQADYEVNKNRRKKEEIESRMDRVSADLSRFRTILSGIERDAFEGYSRYGQIIGGTAGVSFSSDWALLVRRASELNRNSGLHFEQLPIGESTINISTSASNSLNGSPMPILFGASIPGFRINDMAKNGEYQSMPMEIDEAIKSGIAPWISAVSGQIDLSLIGACELLDSENRLSLRKANEAVGASIKINAFHTYPMTLVRRYEVVFNPKRILDELEGVSETGGFLSSTKIHEVIENNITKDVFDVIFYNNGRDNGFTDEEEKQIRLDAKREIVDKILQEIGAIAQIDSERPPLPELERSSGARFVYGALPCFGYPICMAAGFIIGVTDAFFGRTEVTTKFKKVNNIEVRHRYSSESPAYLAVSTTYKTRNN